MILGRINVGNVILIVICVKMEVIVIYVNLMLHWLEMVNVYFHSVVHLVNLVSKQVITVLLAKMEYIYMNIVVFHHVLEIHIFR
jgi:hypothetical protein